MTHTDLIQRLSEATEGSREIDAEIAVAVFDEPSPADDMIYAKLPHRDDECETGTYWRKSRSGMSLRTAPHYTTSIDAALSLVPETHLFRGVVAHRYGTDENYQVKRDSVGNWSAYMLPIDRHRPPGEIIGHHDNMILAVVIGALMARETKE